MIGYETPHDGMVYEMSFVQAQVLHQQWPIRLHKVLETHAAEFMPVSGFMPEFVPKVLPMPPFEIDNEPPSSPDRTEPVKEMGE